MFSFFVIVSAPSQHLRPGTAFSPLRHKASSSSPPLHPDRSDLEEEEEVMSQPVNTERNFTQRHTEERPEVQQGLYEVLKNADLY